jgi:hypothetical protein
VYNGAVKTAASKIESLTVVLDFEVMNKSTIVMEWSSHNGRAFSAFSEMAGKATCRIYDVTQYCLRISTSDRAKLMETVVRPAIVVGWME